LSAEAGHVEQTVSMGIWYMPHNTCEFNLIVFISPYIILFTKPDVFSNIKVMDILFYNV
jgi:hypothetical protein